MKQKHYKSGSGDRRLTVSGAIAALLLSLTWQAALADAFVVRDMRVEGLQRISEGTVFNYLPINIGDEIDELRVQEAIRAVYQQGLFDEIEMRRDDNTLIIVVKERPSIESFTIDGNKDIKTEDLMDSLRSVGLARGKTFDRSVLDEVQQFLQEQYFNRGKYAVAIDADVIERPNNTVRINVQVKEGDRARIRQVNVVGNHSFSDKEVRDGFELDTANWLSWLRQDDRYAKESLSGDLETLRSYYMDRGFADFRVESTQVAISPDKKDIFITINVHEGERYTISDIKMVGDMVVPEEQLRNFILAKPGSSFNLALLTQSAELISFRLGEEGYANAEIEPVPELDKEGKEAAITFYVDPGNRVYVRNINFNGVTEVDDEVLRREMRQLEGSYLSNRLVDRSKIRLQRLPFVENVEVENTPIAGSPDLVDVDFDIEYRMPGQFTGGVGYSEAMGVMLNGSIVHTNFMGTGNRVALEANTGRYQTYYTLSHSDPYVTRDGVRRTISANYRDLKAFTASASDFSTTSMGAGIDFGYPLSEYQSLSIGLNYQHSELLATERSSLQAREWVQANGKSYTREGFLGTPIYGTEFDSFEIMAGWSYDSRNRAIFADRGMQQRVILSMAAPGSDVEFFTARYDFTKYFPIYKGWTIMLNSEIAYGEALGDTTALPPYKHFFGGGPGSVRGYHEMDLGPTDSYGNPYGGNLLVASQLELILPLPEKWQSKTRASFFVDVGNVFDTGEVNYRDRLGSPMSFDFDVDELRASAGVAVQWLAPLGFFRFSYAYPLNAFNGNDRYFGDRLERFQFSMGNAF